jgi:hypothetical protein
MQKAKLTGGQVVAAIFAGIIGHLFFSIGWITLGIALFGGVIAAVLGGSLAGIIGSIADPESIGQLLGGAGGVVGGLVLGIGIAAFVLMTLGFLFSGLILKGGRVRRPWATTWTSIVIAAIIDVPLLFAYAAITANRDSGPTFGLVAVLGTVVVGILVWLWMTWGHRGSASEFEAAHATSASVTAPVTAAATAPAVEAVATTTEKVAASEPVAAPAAEAVKATATAKAPVPKKAPQKS